MFLIVPLHALLDIPIAISVYYFNKSVRQAKMLAFI